MPCMKNGERRQSDKPKPPWTQNIPVNSGKVRKIAFDRLTEAEKKNIWLGIQSLNPALADAIKQKRTAPELDIIDMLRYYTAGEKIAARQARKIEA